MICVTPAAKSQSIANWTFNNLLTGIPGTYNSIGIADFATGVPVHAFNGSSEYYGEGNWPSGALNPTMYLEFIIIPLPGYQLDVNSVVLRIRRSNTGSPAGAGPNSWSLRSSLDGFAANIASGSMNISYADYTVTPGSNFLNLYLPVVFRLYGYNATVNAGGSSRLVVDNISATGLGYLLPVKLQGLTATLQQNKVNLHFTIANTEENSIYNIERSINGLQSNSIGSIRETGTMVQKQYNYSDDITALSTAPLFYYRVRVVNNQNLSSFSPIVVVKKQAAKLSLKSIVRNRQLYISGELAPGSYHVMLYTTGGQALTQLTFTAAAGYNTCNFRLPVSVPAVYVLQLVNNNGYVYTSSGTSL